MDFNTVNIITATMDNGTIVTSVLDLGEVLVVDGGQYSCIATNEIGSQDSREFTLDIESEFDSVRSCAHPHTSPLMWLMLTRASLSVGVHHQKRLNWWHLQKTPSSTLVKVLP